MGKDYRWTFDQYDHGRKRMWVEDWSEFYLRIIWVDKQLELESEMHGQWQTSDSHVTGATCDSDTS